MKTRLLLLVAMSLVAIGGGVYLVGKNQETRRGATYAGVGVSFWPNTKVIGVGETFWVTMMLDANSQKLSGLEAKIRYDKNRLKVLTTEVVTADSVGVGESGGLFKAVTDVFDNSDNQSEGYISLAGVSMEEIEAKMATGVVKILKINLEAIAPGEGKVGMWTADTNTIVGHNVNGNDKGLAITSYADGIYTIQGGETPSPTPGEEIPSPTPGGETGPRMRFMFRFSGVDASAQCAENWPISIIVLGEGKTAVYTTTPQRLSTITDRAVFLADFRLNGFEAKEGLALFVRGPKHIQMKYGDDLQERSYWAVGGKLSVLDENKIYDFSKYPMLAGDVTGPNETRDGVINVLDFSQMKNKAGTHLTVQDSNYLPDDLDGNCQLAPNDVEVLKQSLGTKQDELY